MDRFKKIVVGANRFLSETCGWLLCVMVVILCFDIVSRGIKESVPGVTVMAVFVMIAVVYLGLGQCEKYDRHIKVTVVIDRLPAAARNGLRIFNDLVQLIILTVICVAVAQNVAYSIRKHEAVAGYFHLPIWPVKFFLLLGVFFYLLQVVVNLYEKVSTLVDRKKRDS